jgi:hypothetical protein
MRIQSMTTLLLLILMGCADTDRKPAPVESQVGKNCIVYFRRDALGMGADTPSSVTTGMHNGAEVTQAGELMAVGNDWIVINLHGREFHIPQAAILMVEFGNNISGKPGLSEPLQPAPENHGDHTSH